MKIRVKVGDIEIEYINEQKTNNEPACMADSYSKGSDREALMKTIGQIAREARELYDTTN